MKILELNTFAGSGSTGRIALDIANCAYEHGWETVIGFGAGNVPPEAKPYAMRIGGDAGRKWHGALRKLLDMEGYGSLLATWKLIRFMKRWKPDVVHLHNIHGCYLNHAALFHYLRRAGMPVVWTLHDCWPFTGHCAYFDFVGCDRWQTQCKKCPQKKSYPTCVGLDGSARNYRRRRRLFTSLPNLTLVTPCHWLKGLLGQSFLKDVPVCVIENGVNRDLFRPQESNLRLKHDITEKYVALAVASEWEKRKGFYLLPNLQSALGDEYRLVVIGLTRLHMFVLPGTKLLGLERTESQRELAQWYTAADCFVNPTLEDNMPLVNLEALACGTPVAVFDTGGCPECVDEDCGAVAPKGDVAALARAVQSLSPIKKDLTPACLARAEKFDSLASAQAYCDLYRKVKAYCDLYREARR